MGIEIVDPEGKIKTGADATAAIRAGGKGKGDKADLTGALAVVRSGMTLEEVKAVVDGEAELVGDDLESLAFEGEAQKAAKKAAKAEKPKATPPPASSSSAHEKHKGGGSKHGE